MNEFDIGMQTVSHLPMWLDVFIGIVAALGGWEAIKYLLSLRANRRKDKAEAAQGGSPRRAERRRPTAEGTRAAQRHRGNDEAAIRRIETTL